MAPKSKRARKGSGGPSTRTSHAITTNQEQPFLYTFGTALSTYQCPEPAVVSNQLVASHPLIAYLLSGDTTPSDDPTSDYVYWVVLATQVLHQLQELQLSMLLPEEQESSSVSTTLGPSVAASWMSYVVCQTLLPNLPKPERLTGAAPRHVVGRLLLAVSTACTEALYRLSGCRGSSISGSSTKDDTPASLPMDLRARCVQACIVCLDTVVVATRPTHSFWTNTKAAAGMDWDRHGRRLRDVLGTVGDPAQWTVYAQCLEQVQGMTTTTTTKAPPHASRNSRNTITATTAMQAIVHVVSSEENNRLALRRWTGTALVWYGRGQEKLYEAALGLVRSWHDWPHSVEQGSVPPDVTVLTLVSRLFRIVCEAGLVSGVRPPVSGGFCSYVSALAGPKLKARVELRDVGTMACYHLIQRHCHCLKQSFPAVVAGGERWLLVNEHHQHHEVAATTTTPAGDTAVTKCLYYPFIHTAIEDVATAVAANNGGKRNFGDRIEFAMAAYALKDMGPIVDLQLTNYAMRKLQVSLDVPKYSNPDMAISAVAAANNGSASGKKKKDAWKLDKPLPIPSATTMSSAPPKNRKRKAPTKERASPFADLFAKASSAMTTDEKLSLFLRALPGGSSSLVSHLVQILATCYDTRVSEGSTTALSPDEKADRNKRGLPSLGSRSGKRRKRNSKKSVEETDFVAVAVAVDGPYRRIEEARINLAVPILEALGMFLRDPLAFQNDSKLSELQSSLRMAVTNQHIEKLIELGSLLDEIIVKPREIIESEKVGVSKVTEDPLSLSTDEKSLWTSHMNMCSTLGRGQTEYTQSKVSLLDQHFICRKISGQSKLLSSKSTWPLCLNPANRVLLSASVTCEDVTKQQKANIFVVEGFLSELSVVLEDLSTLASFVSGHNKVTAFEEVPVSLHDSRIFLAFLSLLPPTRQGKVFSSLVTLLDEGLKRVDDSSVNACSDEETTRMAGFFARVVSLCVHTYVMIRFGVQARTELLRVLGNTAGSHLPVFRPDSEWHYGNRCFMSVFSDWEDTEIPLFEPSVNEIDSKSEEDMQRLFHTALRVGVRVARYDHGHLVFAAWNALGKGDLWNTIPTAIQPIETLPDNLCEVLVQLRDELCLVQRMMKRSQGTFFGVSTLLRAIEGQERKSKSSPSHFSSNDIKKCLSSMVDKVSNLVTELLARFVPSDKTIDQDIPNVVFCLFEAASIYLAFSISSFTLPTSDFFTQTMQTVSERAQNRARSYSTDSEAAHSVGGSADSQDILVDTLERLQDVCESIGAVPAHPDWLDSSCKLRDGVSETEASQIAHKALICLTKLTTAGMSQFELLQTRALRNSQKGLDKKTASLVYKLFWMHAYESGKYDNDGEQYDSGGRSIHVDIGEVCKVDPKVIHLLLPEHCANKREGAKMSFSLRSAQRAFGRLQELFKNSYISDIESPELRGSGEWEVLLAGSLSSACMHIEKSQRSSPIDDNVYNTIERSSRWHDVLWIVMDCLVPVSALLRFCVPSQRMICHPLSSFDVNPDDFLSKDYEPLQVSLQDSVSKSGAKELGEAINLILGILASFPGSRTCGSIATQLLLHSDNFAVLQRLDATVSGLVALSGLREISQHREIARPKAQALVDRISWVLEKFAVDHVGGAKSSGWGRLDIVRCCLQTKSTLPELMFTTISTEDVHPCAVLQNAWQILGIDEPWHWIGSKVHYILTLFSCMWSTSLISSANSRAFLCRLMSVLVEQEYHENLKSSVATFDFACPMVLSLNNASVDDIQTMIQNDGCGDLSDGPNLRNTQSSVRKLLAYFIASELPFKKANQIFLILQDQYKKWKEFDFTRRREVIHLTLLYACHNTAMDEVACWFFDDLRSAHNLGFCEYKDLENIQLFAEFLGSLHTIFSMKPVCSGAPRNSDCAELTSCSFATKNEFHEQHWYNCYTCGLTGDLGCCSFCAHTCHDGHDVSYARFSSFFCDCGGEEVPKGNQSKYKCKAPQKRDKAKQKERRHDLMSRNSTKNCSDQRVLSPSSYAMIVKGSFPEKGETSFKSIIENPLISKWTRFLFTIAREHFVNWQSLHRQRTFKWNDGSNIDCYRVLKNNLNGAHGKLNVKRNLEPGFTLIGVTRSSAFQMKISQDSRSRMLRDGFVRSLVGADNRGRIVVVDNNKLLFCNALSVINQPPPDKIICRSSLNIIGSSSIGFGDIVGLRVSENCLVVWNAVSVKYFCMNDSLTKIIHSATLDLGSCSGEDGSEFISSCDWLCSLSKCLVVCRRQTLLVFQISELHLNASPCLQLSVKSFPSRIQDFAVVGCSAKHRDLDAPKYIHQWKIYVLFANGRLHEGTLSRDGEKNLKIEAKLDHENAVYTPDEVSESNSIGKGSLVYLQQCNLLIYQSHCSSATALFLNEKGKIKESLELLPYELMSVSDKKDSTVTGPFTHWTELGAVCRDSASYFRTSCIARRAGEPVLLRLEFDHISCQVAELPRSETGWFDSPQSCEGCTAISAPILKNSDDASGALTREEFAEHVVLCSLTLNGCLHFYMENVGAPSRAALEPDNEDHVFYPNGKSDLLVFERLKNITSRVDVKIWTDDSSESGILKSKLAPDCDDFVISPSREGFAIHISMLDGLNRSPLNESLDYSSTLRENDGIAIAAVRVLVGLTSQDCVPRSISVMGKTLDIAAGERRWYSFQLSAQEIALVIRSGFLTVAIQQCHDSIKCPLIDSLEVYGIHRHDIESWLPHTLKTVLSTANVVEAKDERKYQSSRNSFLLALTSLSSVIGVQELFKPNRTEKTLLRQFVQDTALEKNKQIDDAVGSLVSSLQQDEDSRQFFHDEAVLQGCSDFLKRCKVRFVELKASRSAHELQQFWNGVVPSVRTCFQIASKIARLRPFNYHPQTDEKPHSYGSIAADASMILDDYLSIMISSDKLISDFVELSLLETAVANGAPKGLFGSFDGLRRLISFPHQAVVGQTCSSISKFCRGCDIFSTQMMAVRYVCDSCMNFINVTRYTLLDEDHPFDLCPECFEHGKEFCKSVGHEEGRQVLIRGKAVGNTPKLTCSKVQAMQAVSVPRAAAIAAPSTASAVAGTGECEESGKAELAHRQQLFNDFMDGLFSGIGGLLGEKLRERNNTPKSLVWLSVDLVRHCFETGRKLKGAKALADCMARGFSSRLDSAMLGGEVSDDCSIFLEGLTSLFVPDKICREYLLGSDIVDDQAKISDNAQLIHCTHGKQAVRRKVKTGNTTSSTFFSCSNDIRHRCNFFSWVNSPATAHKNQAQKSLFNDEIAKHTWGLFSVPYKTEKALHLRLCEFTESLMKNFFDVDKPADDLVPTLFRQRCYSRDCDDGVLCYDGRLMHETLLRSLPTQKLLTRHGTTSNSTKGSIVRKCLELLCLVATPNTDDCSAWFPILCRIINAGKGKDAQAEELRMLAKKSLRKLCGRNSKISTAVRDHFTFSFHWENLSGLLSETLSYCVLLNEKSRICCDAWKSDSPLLFSDLSVGKIVGVENLVTENAGSVQSNEKAGKVLDAVLSVARKRTNSWKRFCGLKRIPTGYSSLDGPNRAIFSSTSPLKLLYGIACSTSAENEVKALRLLSVGSVSNAKITTTPGQEGSKVSSSEEEQEIDGVESEKKIDEMLSFERSNDRSVIAVSVDDIQAFVSRFVCRGTSSEVRSLSNGIALQLCKQLCDKDRSKLLITLFESPLCFAGRTGKRCADFLTFLQSLLRLTDSASTDACGFASLAESHLLNQIVSLRCDRVNGESVHFETRSSSSVQKKRFEMACCSSCCIQNMKDKNNEKPSVPTPANRGNVSTSIRSHRSAKTKWLPNQVSPAVRGRLDPDRDSCASDEFSSYYALRHRLVVTSIHLEVENPRRFVKTVNFYFSPRPEVDLNVLKSDAFKKSWKPCGTMSLARGASSGTFTLSTPVVASGLRIEYASFYERSPHTKSSEGALIIHCPRCTRIVTNAHGVCANCGEVAFQCRKCRHINYDRLDAFLCVECGYCASATILCEVTAGVASNAVAITNDADFADSSQKAMAAARIHQDLKNALKYKLKSLLRVQKKSVEQEEQKWFGSALLKGVYGGSILDESDAEYDFSKLTPSMLGRQGSIVRMLGSLRDDTEISPFPAVRKEHSDDSNSSRTEGLVSRGTRHRDGDDDESATELLGGLLDNAGSLTRYGGLDPGDPLSRLLANVQSRRERREAQDREQAENLAAANTTTNSAKEKGTKNATEAVEMCDRLYQLMREAERESEALERRRKAWLRLQEGSLENLDERVTHFEPSHCSVCSPTVALQLLLLWQTIFKIDPQSVKVTKKMVSMLLNGDVTASWKHLQEVKRSVVKDIALLSPTGAPLVLSGLRGRVLMMKDVNCAEILGKILQNGGGDNEAAAAPFFALAREAMESEDD